MSKEEKEIFEQFGETNELLEEEFKDNNYNNDKCYPNQAAMEKITDSLPLFRWNY